MADAGQGADSRRFGGVRSKPEFAPRSGATPGAGLMGKPPIRPASRQGRGANALHDPQMEPPAAGSFVAVDAVVRFLVSSFLASTSMAIPMLK